VKAKEESFKQLQNTVAQLRDYSANHPVHNSVGEATQHYHDIDNAIESRTKMLSEFKPRVAEYEREVEIFTQWLTDCCKRVDQLPVADMSTDGADHQLQVSNVTDSSKLIIYVFEKYYCYTIMVTHLTGVTGGG